MTIQEMLDLVIAKDAGDLHLVVGSPPTLRISGRLEFIGDQPLTHELAQELVLALVRSQGQLVSLLVPQPRLDLELIFSFFLPDNISWPDKKLFGKLSPPSSGYLQSNSELT